VIFVTGTAPAQLPAFKNRSSKIGSRKLHDLYLLFVRAPCVERVRASFCELRQGAPPKFIARSRALPLRKFCGEFLVVLNVRQKT